MPPVAPEGYAIRSVSTSLGTRARLGTHRLVDTAGPGVFVAGHVTKTGGATGLTFVRLVIDSRVIVDVTFAAARTFVFPIENPYGVLRSSSDGIHHLGFGWPVPLVFRRSLTLTVIVNERAVSQLLGEAIVGSVRC